MRTKKNIRHTGAKKVILDVTGPGFNFSGTVTPMSCLVMRSVASQVMTMPELPLTALVGERLPSG